MLWTFKTSKLLYFFLYINTTILDFNSWLIPKKCGIRLEYNQGSVSILFSSISFPFALLTL